MLSGTVASRDDRDRLVLFVRTYWDTARAVDDELVIDPHASVFSGLRLVDLESAPFDDDSDVITPALAVQLDRLVSVMLGAPELSLHVVGNTDEAGDPTRNLVVSQRRANAVVNYLASRGVSWSRLTTQPAGESNPLEPELIGSASQLNNRTEVVVFGLIGR